MRIRIYFEDTCIADGEGIFTGVTMNEVTVGDFKIISVKNKEKVDTEEKPN